MQKKQKLNLEKADPDVFNAVEGELYRQQNSLELIASENIVNQAVLQAQGSVFTNKYAEGYPGRRYYGGCKFVDKIENLAIDRAKKLFNAKFANVQPHSGSQANQAVFLALLSPGDTIMSMSLDSGGHLTHGSAVNLSGKWFNIVHYNVDRSSFLLKYDDVRSVAKIHRPKLIIAGGSAYSRKIDFQRFREIADEVGAYLLIDMAHFAGLVAATAFDNPVDYAHIVTSTTHKTLRGPRGGIILTNEEELAKKVNSAIFPGLQGGPLMHVIAAKAVALGEALQDDFKDYIKTVIDNAKLLAEELISQGYQVLTNGTDTHLLLVDLRPQRITGKIAEKSLENAGLTCNKNSIPYDKEKPFITSGIRLGTAAITSRGIGAKETKQIAHLIAKVLNALATNPEDNSVAEKAVHQDVLEICKNFPIY